MLRKRRIALLVTLPLLAGLCLSLPSASYGAGFGVDPVSIIVKDCPLGEKVSVKDVAGEEMMLRIHNKEAVAYSYTINVLTSSQTNQPVGGGYSDIPDTSWIIPEYKEGGIQIPGNTSKSVKVYLNIPKKQQCYDKKYRAIIEVKRKKNIPEEMFVLAVQIRMSITTRQRTADSPHEAGSHTSEGQGEQKNTPCTKCQEG